MKENIGYNIYSSKRKKKPNNIKFIIFLIAIIAIMTIFIRIKFFGNTKDDDKVNNTYVTNRTSTKTDKDSKKSKPKDKSEISEKKSLKNKDGIIEMTVDEIWGNKDKEKIAFLTFDDGPSKNTPKILDILDEYKIKATFFILGTSAKNFPKDLRKEVELKHSIGNHTYNHSIRYRGNNTPENFVKDVKHCDSILKEVLGENFKTNLVRFPGGSFGHKNYEKTLQASGFKHINWNVENGDARRLNVPKDELIKNVEEGIKNHNHLVILMHDSSTKATTVEALPDTIKLLKNKGFRFGIISQQN